MSNFFSLLSDVFFPVDCILCGKKISTKESHLCSDCKNYLTSYPNGCPVCNGDLAEKNCAFCSERQVYFDLNRTVFENNEKLSKIIKLYKFHNRKKISDFFSYKALNIVREQFSDCDLITSVPVSRKARYVRGFNQSEVIAKKIAKLQDIEYIDLLKDEGNSLKQKNQKYNDRFLNILGRYCLKKKINLSGRKILLFDDVFTTGATINECSRILKKTGAEKVFSLTLTKIKNNIYDRIVLGSVN